MSSSSVGRFRHALLEAGARRSDWDSGEKMANLPEWAAPFVTMEGWEYTPKHGDYIYLKVGERLELSLSRFGGVQLWESTSMVAVTTNASLDAAPSAIRHAEAVARALQAMQGASEGGEGMSQFTDTADKDARIAELEAEVKRLRDIETKARELREAEVRFQTCDCDSIDSYNALFPALRAAEKSMDIALGRVKQEVEG